jgi:hypothetical protein
MTASCVGCHDPRVFGHRTPCPLAERPAQPRGPKDPAEAWLWVDATVPLPRPRIYQG